MYPIPGPSVLVTALAVSGLSTNEFTYLGFLPSQERVIEEGIWSRLLMERGLLSLSRRLTVLLLHWRTSWMYLGIDGSPYAVN